MSHGGLKRARSWKQRIQPKDAYSSPGLLYSETCANACSTTDDFRFAASLDRKRLGADFCAEGGSRSEAFSIGG